MSVGYELKLLEGFFAVDVGGGYFADEAGWSACVFEFFDEVFVEDHCSRVYESFVVVRGEFGSHDSVVVFAGTFGDIPVDCFECCAFLPEPPEVFAGFFASGGDIVVVAVGKQTGGEVTFEVVRGKWYAVLFDLEPGDEQSFEL